MLNSQIFQHSEKKTRAAMKHVDESVEFGSFPDSVDFPGFSHIHFLQPLSINDFNFNLMLFVLTKKGSFIYIIYQNN